MNLPPNSCLSQKFLTPTESIGYRRTVAEAADVDEDDSLSVEADGDADSARPIGPAAAGVETRSFVASSCSDRLRFWSPSLARERLHSARSSFISVFVAVRFSILPPRFAIVALEKINLKQ